MNNDVELIPVKGVLPSVQVQSDNVIYVPQAHKNKAGIVKEGDGVLIENGVVSLNKQTVEDMIDANKWVSYGFQQNLTEDEKGMARHNIGAGDNDFTGSYYDVTQKPHLNTDNIYSLDTGDEEINNTINLHKVSKTGSFDDLNDVPTDTLDFAESERQKSKNLLNISDASSYTTNGVTLTIQDNIITLNGTTTAFTTFIRPHDLITANVGNYAFSFKYISGTISGNSGPMSLYNQVGKNEICYPNTSKINDITEVTNYNRLRIAISNGITFNNFKYALQYEEGTVATDYQPYNGAIIHEKEVSDIEHIEVLYDDSSSDANINWGKTGGIYGGDVVSDKDFTKYKKLIVYSYHSGNILTTIIPLRNTPSDSYIGCNAGLSNDTTDIQCIKCSVNSAKTEFKVDAMGYYNTSGFVLRNGTNAYLVFKIEGVY